MTDYMPASLGSAPCPHCGILITVNVVERPRSNDIAGAIVEILRQHQPSKPRPEVQAPKP